jgi:ABC-type sugar transport system ATPase subunit
MEGTEREKHHVDHVLELRGIEKSFGSVAALRNVDFELRENEILGLVGDNGAGKSTLIKIISGVYPQDAGDLFFRGEKVTDYSISKARELGIETVYQDSALFGNLSPTENVFAGRELVRSGPLGLFGVIDRRRMHKETERLLLDIQINIKFLNEGVEHVSGGERQAIAIARAVYWKKSILLLDEPTAALGVRESATSLDLISRIRQELGLSIVIISHNLEHVLRISDRVIALRQGKRTGTLEITREDRKDTSRLALMIQGLEWNPNQLQTG